MQIHQAVVPAQAGMTRFFAKKLFWIM